MTDVKQIFLIKPNDPERARAVVTARLWRVAETAGSQVSERRREKLFSEVPEPSDSFSLREPSSPSSGVGYWLTGNSDSLLKPEKLRTGYRSRATRPSHD